MNGRIQNTKDDNYQIYSLFNENHKINNKYCFEAVKSIHSINNLNRVFFSQKNVDVLQDIIRYKVFIASNKKHIIDRQSDTELRHIMRGMYLQFGENREYDILSQVKTLNKTVLEFCVPRILQEIGMYQTYRNDKEKLPIPLERGQLSTSKGTKTLIMNDF